MGALMCFSVKAQTTNPLEIEGVEIAPEETATTVYYLKNVGTGLYVSYGGEWGTHCIETNAAHPIAVETNGEYVALGSLVGYLDSNTLWMDWSKSYSKWKLEKVTGYTNQYYIVSEDGRVLSSVGNSAGLLQLAANAERTTSYSRSFQRWVFLSEEDMRQDKMAEASETNPMDVTPLIKAATFDLVDGFESVEVSEHNPDGENPAVMGGLLAYNSAWTNYADYDKWLWECGFRSGNPSEYNWIGVIDGPVEAINVVQSVTLPAGTYHFSFEGFYTNEKKIEEAFQTKESKDDEYQDSDVDVTISNATMTATVSVAGLTFNIPQGSATELANFDNIEGGIVPMMRDTDTYEQCGNFYLSEETTVDIMISKGATSENTVDNGTGGYYNIVNGQYERNQTRTSYRNRIYLDDFSLTYYGAEDVSGSDFSHSTVYTVYLKANIDEYKTMLNDAGKAVFDGSDLVVSIKNGEIDDKAEYYDALAELENVYKEALQAHAMASVTGEGADVTHLIVNNSFEKGTGDGWSYLVHADAVGDMGVYDWATEGKDGTYLFNSWCGQTAWWGWWPITPVEQTISLPNGLYELKALVASDPERKMYVVGEGYYNGVQAAGAGTFVESSVEFLVEDGTATIKACASNLDLAFGTYYWPAGGTWYKADNFRMNYVCDEAHGRVKLALDEANNIISGFDAYGKNNIDISDIQTAFDGRMVSDDGRSLVSELRNRLVAAVKTQRTVGADMTAAIVNPSFETGDLTGWTVTNNADTRVAPHENMTYATLGVDGRYLFNNWNGDGDSDIASPVSQTISGLPNGTYRLTASLTSHAGKTLFVSANGSVSEGAVSEDNTRFVTATVEFEVTDGTATIGAAGGRGAVYSPDGGCYYKADNFRLTYLGNDITLNETDAEVASVDDWYTSVTLNRTIKPNTWSTFVSPFDIPASALEGWEVKYLYDAVQIGDVISLRFTNSTEGIKAGKPYMVRNSSLGENLTSITVENVDVNTNNLNHTDMGIVKFVGQYVSQNVPVGDYFISDNVFYCAKDNTNTMKGYRARLVPASSEVKSIRFSFDDDSDFTAIEGVENVQTAEPVAIYGADGALRADYPKGLNIVKMSDGTVQKVLVK